jgi:hypothetical protein
MNPRDIGELGPRRLAALQSIEFGRGQSRQYRFQACRTFRVHLARIVAAAGFVGIEQRCHDTSLDDLVFRRPDLSITGAGRPQTAVGFALGHSNQLPASTRRTSGCARKNRRSSSGTVSATGV